MLYPDLTQSNNWAPAVFQHKVSEVDAVGSWVVHIGTCSRTVDTGCGCRMMRLRLWHAQIAGRDTAYVKACHVRNRDVEP